MNQLPEVFPIRYAMVIDTGSDEDFDDRPLLPGTKVGMLFRQYILKLQRELLSKFDLRPNANYVKASFLDIDIAYIVKLEGGQE